MVRLYVRHACLQVARMDASEEVRVPGLVSRSLPAGHEIHGLSSMVCMQNHAGAGERIRLLDLHSWRVVGG